MARLIAWLDRLLSIVLILLMAAMVVSITTEIVLNAIIQRIGAWLEKDWEFVGTLSTPVNTISQVLLVWLGILGSALAWRLRAHLGVDALVRVYPPKVRLAMDYLSTILVGVFAGGVLLYGGYMVTADAFVKENMMPGLQMINRGWFYMVLPITGFLTLIYCIYHLIHPKPVEVIHLDEVPPPTEGTLNDA